MNQLRALVDRSCLQTMCSRSSLIAVQVLTARRFVVVCDSCDMLSEMPKCALGGPDGTKVAWS
jgi:hypothetical protein